jgi:uncharacterized membrane protein
LDRNKSKRSPQASTQERADLPRSFSLTREGEKNRTLLPHDETFRFCWPWWRWALTGLTTLGLMLSSYLSWHYLAGGTVIGCGGGSPCDQILNSRWSSVAGVLPVSGLAMGVYLAMLVANFFIGPTTAAPVRGLAWRAMLVLVGAVAGSAVWFIIVQKWVIGTFCPYCMATHITGLLLAALVIWQALKQFDENSRRIIGRLSAAGLTLAGLGLAGTVAVSRRII